ncbi:MAG: hypothetical protein A3K19_00140 [Lentisphaerae bacterium RIFOXYB12_FULL_65_16]|nr:MAG: hypothetical protein A3K18_10335 [Lentisphaerae bacterium RIFOXYA12_64_32]OGV86204.1 MAG: hypothetical protein A3K19_00140 [Lentisphaerae bacterium RIFOXYB12_FULL_65_16]
MEIGSIAMSGMQAAAYSAAVSTHNIANALTPGFHARQVSFSERPGGTRATAYETNELTDYVRETVNSLSAKNLYTANAKLYLTYDEMVGTLLDITA